jgi:subtilisin family serine protease
MLESRFRRLAPAALVWLAVAAALAQPGEEKIDDRLIAEVSDAGRAVAIVRLSLDASFDGGMLKTRADAAGDAQDRLLSDLAPLGIKPRARFETIPYLLFDVDSRALNALAAHPLVVSLFADTRVEGHTSESAAAIRSDIVVDLFGFDGSGVTVAIVDTGVQPTHPDLAGAVIGGHRFLQQGAIDDGLINDDNGHGTHVAGIVTGDGVLAPRGIAPGASLVAVKALDENRGGFLSDVARGLDWLAANRNIFPGLAAVNMSLGAANASPDCECDGVASFALMRDAANALAALDVALVASTGNAGLLDSIASPACLSSVVSVGASYDAATFRAPAAGTFQTLAGSTSFADCFDDAPQLHQIACFSNRSACLDFLAPGHVITAPTLGNGVGDFIGTSSASPHLAAVLALLKERAGGLATMDQIVEVARQNSPSALDVASGRLYKRIDAASAFQALPSPLNRAAGAWFLYR